MPSSYVGLVYHVESRKLRHTIIPDDATLLNGYPLNAGEALVRMPKAAYHLMTLKQVLASFDLKG